MAIEMLGFLLALHVSPADKLERDHVEALARKVPEVTGESVELAYIDQGYTGEQANVLGFAIIILRWLVDIIISMAINA